MSYLIDYDSSNNHDKANLKSEIKFKTVIGTPEFIQLSKNKIILNTELIDLVSSQHALKRNHERQLYHKNFFREKSFTTNKKDQPIFPPSIKNQLSFNKVLPSITKSHSDLHESKIDKKKKQVSLNLKAIESSLKLDPIDKLQTSKKLYDHCCKFNLSKPVILKKSDEPIKVLPTYRKYESKSLDHFRPDALNKKGKLNLFNEKLKKPFDDISINATTLKPKDLSEINEDLKKQKNTLNPSILSTNIHSKWDVKKKNRTSSYLNKMQQINGDSLFAYPESDETDNRINFNLDSCESIDLIEYSKLIRYN